jgi:hypothetical protein
MVMMRKEATSAVTRRGMNGKERTRMRTLKQAVQRERKEAV